MGPLHPQGQLVPPVRFWSPGAEAGPPSSLQLPKMPQGPPGPACPQLVKSHRAEPGWQDLEQIPGPGRLPLPKHCLLLGSHTFPNLQQHPPNELLTPSLSSDPMVPSGAYTQQVLKPAQESWGSGGTQARGAKWGLVWPLSQVPSPYQAPPWALPPPGGAFESCQQPLLPPGCDSVCQCPSYSYRLHFADGQGRCCRGEARRRRRTRSNLSASSVSRCLVGYPSQQRQDHSPEDDSSLLGAQGMEGQPSPNHPPEGGLPFQSPTLGMHPHVQTDHSLSRSQRDSRQGDVIASC